MPKSFVRGSQIYFHFLHMFLQSLKRIIFISFLSGSIAASTYLFANANFYIFRPDLAYKYGISELTTSLNVEKQVQFKDIFGKSITISNQKYLSWYKQHILPKLYSNMGFALNRAAKWFEITFIIITILMYFKGRSQNKDRHLRGMKLVKPQQLKKMVIWHNFRYLLFKPYQIGKFPYPKGTESQHTIITGASGTGKTQVILELLAQIRARGDKAIIYDKMGSYVRKFYDPNKDVILNPFDARSKYWDFFGEGKARNQKGLTRTDFDMMAASLIPENPRAADPFWTKAAKTVLTEAAFALSKMGDCNNKKLCDFLLKSSPKQFAKFLARTDASAVIDEKADKTSASIRSVLSTYVNPLKFITNDDQPSFSIRDWVKNQNQDSFLFLSSIADKHESLKPLLSLWLDLGLNALLSTDQNKSQRIWFIIDELPSLQKLPALTYGLAESRQFGGSFVISMQLMAQLKEIYGRDGAESISGLCRTRLTFSTPDEENARWCSENLGRKEMMVFKENISFGANDFRDGVNLAHNKETENIVIASEIMTLKDLEFYIKLSNGFPIAKSKIDYQGMPDKTEKMEEKDEPEQEPLQINDLLKEKSTTKKKVKLQDLKITNENPENIEELTEFEWSENSENFDLELKDKEENLDESEKLEEIKSSQTKKDKKSTNDDLDEFFN